MDGPVFFNINWPHFIDGLAEEVEYPSKRLLADGHGNGFLRIDRRHAAYKSVGAGHGDAPNRIIPQVLRHFHGEMDIAGLVVNSYRIENGGKLTCRESKVHHGSLHLHNSSGSHQAKFSCRAAKCALRESVLKFTMYVSVAFFQ